MKKLSIISEIITAVLIIVGIVLFVRCLNLKKELKTYAEENEELYSYLEKTFLPKVDLNAIVSLSNATFNIEDFSDTCDFYYYAPREACVECLREIEDYCNIHGLVAVKISDDDLHMSFSDFFQDIILMKPLISYEGVASMVYYKGHISVLKAFTK